nr:hypothetical protein [Marseillevirus cajuinensis]WRK65207.1 hypothetical protein MarFTME_162 [Marseillevirus futianmevirus]
MLLVWEDFLCQRKKRVMGIVVSVIISFAALAISGTLSAVAASKADEPAKKWAIFSTITSYVSLVIALLIAIFLL